MTKKPILCLDFDGVIHSYSSGWQGPRMISDGPVPGALEFITKAVRLFEVHIFSSRSNHWGGRRAMKKWLYHNYIQLLSAGYHDVPEWAKQLILETYDPWDETVRWSVKAFIKRIKFPRYKPPALITIDDRAEQFVGTFKDPLNYLHFKPWNKK